MFLLATIFTPLVEVIPNEAATPALVLVGFLMMTQVKNIDWDDVEVAIPAFLTIVLMPFTYSITVGIGAGFVTHVLIKLVWGKGREIPARAHRAVLGNSGGEVCVEESYQGVDEFGADTGVTRA